MIVLIPLAGLVLLGLMFRGFNRSMAKFNANVNQATNDMIERRKSWSPERWRRFRRRRNIALAILAVPAFLIGLAALMG